MLPHSGYYLFGIPLFPQNFGFGLKLLHCLLFEVGSDRTLDGNLNIPYNVCSEDKTERGSDANADERSYKTEAEFL
jgi:hypothetical protein